MSKAWFTKPVAVCSFTTSMHSQAKRAGVAQSVTCASFCSAALPIDRYLPRHHCLPVALIFCSLGHQFTSRLVRPWCQPRPSKFWAKRNCCAAECSEYEISKKNHVIFIVAVIISFFFETSSWIQDGRPVASGKAASPCFPPAKKLALTFVVCHGVEACLDVEF